MARRRHEIRRHPERGRYDRPSIDAVLDQALIGHVAFVDGDQPFCIPMLVARAGDEVFVHGSSASRAMRLLSDGTPACLTVTHVDGLVLARSAFDHSANYRSAVLLGSFTAVTDRDAKLAAFRALTEKLVPGRWDEVRPPSDKELRASSIASLTIAEASVKMRTGPPVDEPEDLSLPVWAGVVPVETRFTAPEAAPDLNGDIDIPASVRSLLAGRG